MAGTPTGEPAGDTPAAMAADSDAQAWERPVPTRWAEGGTLSGPGVALVGEVGACAHWAPPADMTAQTVPVNVEVMRTAPGEAPISR